MIEVGSKVEVYNSINYPQLNGTRGTVLKKITLKSEYEYLGEYFKVEYDSPVNVYGRVQVTGLFKESELKEVV